MTVIVALAIGLVLGICLGLAFARVTMGNLVSALSSQALARNNEAFLQLAETRLGRARAEASADIDARRKAVEDLLAPLQQTLQHVDLNLRDAERQRLEGTARLLESIGALDTAGRGLRDETRRLTDALGRPGVRGRWGELQLKRVIELADMLNHCDFEEQRTYTAEERRLRPDVVVHLPGGKHIVVDAKVPLDAYLRALDAPDEPSRKALMQDHARQVRAHLAQLASKDYAARLGLGSTPDFVVMFLPGEVFFSAALEQDPTLIEAGAQQHVIPASPTTLIALLRAVAYGWQQATIEENARKIGELGRALYESVGKVAEHVHTLGARLRGSLDAYNAAVGSLEGNVLVKARKFRELQAATSEDIAAIETIDRVPRVLQAAELTSGLPFAPHDEPDEETVETR